MSGSAVVDVLASPWWVPWDDNGALLPHSSVFLQKQNVLLAVTFHLPWETSELARRDTNGHSVTLRSSKSVKDYKHLNIISNACGVLYCFIQCTPNFVIPFFSKTLEIRRADGFIKLNSLNDTIGW